MRIEKPVVQRDIFIDDRSEVLAAVDVVCPDGDPERLLVSELLVPLYPRLTERDWS